MVYHQDIIQLVAQVQRVLRVLRERSLRTTDTYGMGMALIEMLQFCIFFLPTNMYNTYYLVFSKMCDFNVFERIDEIQAMEMLDQLTHQQW